MEWLRVLRIEGEEVALAREANVVE